MRSRSRVSDPRASDYLCRIQSCLLIKCMQMLVVLEHLHRVIPTQRGTHTRRCGTHGGLRTKVRPYLSSKCRLKRCRCTKQYSTTTTKIGRKDQRSPLYFEDRSGREETASSSCFICTCNLIQKEGAGTSISYLWCGVDWCAFVCRHQPSWCDKKNVCLSLTLAKIMRVQTRRGRQI